MPIWRTTVETTHASLGGVAVNTFHYRTLQEQSLGADAQALAEATALLRGFYVAFANDVAASGAPMRSAGEWVRVEGEQDLITVPGWSIQSEGSTSPLPPSTALCLTWRTSRATRRGRGRTFLSPIRTSALQSNGTPTEAARSAIVNAGQTLIAGNDGADDGQFCVWSEVDQVGRDLVRCTMSNEFAVLRSRRD